MFTLPSVECDRGRIYTLQLPLFITKLYFYRNLSSIISRLHKIPEDFQEFQEGNRIPGDLQDLQEFRVVDTTYKNFLKLIQMIVGGGDKH